MNKQNNYFSEDQIALLKNHICPGFSEEELQIFMHACKRTELDPFMRQIYAVKIWNSKLKKYTMSIQTGIDGYRLIADRTGKYSPGRDTVFNYTKENKLLSASAYVKKMTPDGSWHEIGSEAFWEEYAQRKKDGELVHFWATKPHIMLGKCAEALALRKAFPAELSGIYTKEEMPIEEELPINQEEEKPISDDQVFTLSEYFGRLEEKRQKDFLKHYKISSLTNIKAGQFKAILTTLKRASEVNNA